MHVSSALCAHNSPFFFLPFHLRLLQYMAGGDLGTALSLDANEHEDKTKRRLGWYARGRVVLLCVARGLAYLHSERVRTRRGKATDMVLSIHSSQACHCSKCSQSCRF